MTADGATDPVRLDLDGDLGIVWIDNPPVNAASHRVRAGLVEAFAKAAAEPSIKAVVLACAGRTFVAGADIAEFDRPPAAPVLREVCALIEATEKPVLAVLHGTALGGGFELALACHYRVIDPAGFVALPEVTLGIIPGAGGTQRLPRVAGLKLSLDMITSGKRLSAAEALAAGIVDAVAEGDRMAFGRSFLRARFGQPPPRTDQRPAPAYDAAAFAETRASVAKRYAGQVAPQRAIDALEQTTHGSFAEGIAFEQQIAMELRGSDQARALRHLFFAERACGKIPELAQASPKPIGSVGVVGGGTMGSGIAAAALLAGLPVRMIERDEAAAAAGAARIGKILAQSVARRKLAPGEDEQILRARLAAGTDVAALADSDLIIEAVFEDLATKQAAFRDLDRVAKPGAVLATNTSYLDVAKIAAATQRPSDVIGLHFFSPAQVMRLVEVVVPPTASAQAVATGFGFAKLLGKLPVRAGNADGFIGNRIYSAYRKVGDFLLEDGAGPVEVDAAFRAFGFPMGLFEMQDLAGLDIGWANRKRLAPLRREGERYVRIADRICERGDFGRKSGRGYYLYDDGPLRPNPAVETIIAEERQRKGIRPRSFTPDEIVARLCAAMINEAVRVLEEGIALRPGDIDVVMANGYGFPRWRGGPMHMADARGAAAVLSDIMRFAQDDPEFWVRSALLRECAASGAKLADFEQSAGR